MTDIDRTDEALALAIVDMADYVLSCIEELYGDGGTLSCRYCRVGDLRWGQTDRGNWRLYAPDGIQHTCKEYAGAKIGVDFTK